MRSVLGTSLYRTALENERIRREQFERAAAIRGRQCCVELCDDRDDV